MLALMQGNFGAISGLNSKMRKVLMQKMNQVDTAENRKRLVDAEAEKFKTYLFIPTESINNIHEGFDPLIASSDVIDTHFIKIVNAILDFDETANT